jgi:2',3'-cyclic-nucleotide 2'-phosphodiesterase (5'-nucleotidase family)
MRFKSLNEALYIFLFFLIISGIATSCTTSYKVSSEKDSYLRIDSKLDNKSSKTIDSIIDPYKNTLDQIMNEVIGYSDGLSIGKPESTLGNWVADALETNAENLTGANIAFAVQNHGGIRIREIPAGQVTLSKIYELMPFENSLTLITVDGKIVSEFLDRIAKYGGWPVSKSLKFRIEGETARDILIDGFPLDTAATYILAMPDYVANGGDDCFFFEPLPKNNTEYLIRDILLNEVKKLSSQNEHISAKIEGRIR